MKRAFLGIAAFALLLATAESAKAQIGVSYSTRVGNSGFVTVGYGAPAYGYSYYAPGYYTPTYYSSSYVYPSYYSTPSYVVRPDTTTTPAAVGLGPPRLALVIQHRNADGPGELARPASFLRQATS
jgi:hypothetical protein